MRWLQRRWIVFVRLAVLVPAFVRKEFRQGFWHGVVAVIGVLFFASIVAYLVFCAYVWHILH